MRASFTLTYDNSVGRIKQIECKCETKEKKITCNHKQEQINHVRKIIDAIKSTIIPALEDESSDF